MINNNLSLNPKLFDKDIEQVPSRNGFGEGLLVLGEKNPQVVVLCADLAESTRVLAFAEKYPQRYVEMGVAEQNLAAVASGMAAVGKIPFITSYATFSPGRNWEQIRTTICYNNQPVKIIGSHAGISVGPDGATHQALEDLALMRVLPGMTVISPVDSIEAKKATIACVSYPHPCYIRLSREKVPVVTTEKTPFEIGKAEVFLQGDPSTRSGRFADVTIVATGQLVYRSLLAAEQLKEHGISARVINCHTIKPLDVKTILQAVDETKALVVVEEHQMAGGLGSAIAEVVSQAYPVPLKIIGVADRFGESGKPEELLDKFGLSVSEIIKGVTTVIRMKSHLR